MASPKQLAARAKFKAMVSAKKNGTHAPLKKFPPGSAPAVAVGQAVNPTPIAQAQNVLPVKVNAKPRKPSLASKTATYHATRGQRGF